MADATLSRSPLEPLESGYWEESHRPLASLVFVTPLLVVYEVGILLQGPTASRNGADVWLRALLDGVGFGQYFLLPLMTVLVLLAWHHTTRQPWRFSRGVVAGMFVESAGLAVCLWLILQVQGALFSIVAGPIGPVAAPAGRLSMAGSLSGLIGYLGAGVYEELLFRLILLPATVWGLRWLGVPSVPSLVAGVVGTSLMFAAAHHIGPNGEPLVWFIFMFRALAGIFFCVLFLKRGFGIAAGTHAGYDILVGIFLNSA